MRAVLFSSAMLATLAWSGAGFAQLVDPPSTGLGGAGADTSGSSGNPAFDRAEHDIIPYSAELIEQLARKLHAIKTSEEQSMTEMAAPINRQVNVSFAPGGATSIINTVKGYPTAVSFFDSTGQPWPIEWDTNSNPAAGSGGMGCNGSNANAGGPSVMVVGFHVCTPVKGSNVLEIQPMSLTPRGGLVVSLVGAPRPLTFQVLAGGNRYDSNISVHVADRGPHARVEIMTQSGAPDTGAPFLTGMLQGVPPADAVPLSVEGVSPEGLRAWRLGRHVYLRTRYTLLSPEWTASEAEGGFTVYAVPNTPVVLMAVDGRTVSAALKE